MKIPFQIQFHRPLFLKSDQNPTLKKIFQKEKDISYDKKNDVLINQALMQKSKASRHRILGVLATWNKKDNFQSLAGISSLKNESKSNSANEINIFLPKILEQSGHTCKPTALANLDYFYANLLKIKNIPMHKNNKNFYESETNNYSNNKIPAVSIRKISKQYGSLQGEILQSDDLEKVAEKMGYSTIILKPKGQEDFTKHIEEQLAKGHPILTCFAVSQGKTGDSPIGFPSSIHPENEHACLIVGINKKNKTVDIAHWGKIFSGVQINDLYHSMNILPNTRQPEFYEKNNYRSFFAQSPKYNLVDISKPEKTFSYTLQKSLIPKENSGFKNRLFIMTPNLANERWSQAAHSL